MALSKRDGFLSLPHYLGSVADSSVGRHLLGTCRVDWAVWYVNVGVFEDGLEGNFVGWIEGRCEGGTSRLTRLHALTRLKFFF